MATRVSYRVQKGKSRHVMQAHSTKPGHAVQTTVSTSKILKRPPRKEVYGRKAAHHQRHVYEEHVLFSDWREQIDDSRDHLRKTAGEAFDEAHHELLASLNQLKLDYSGFHDKADEVYQKLAVPLEDAPIELDYKHSDGRIQTKSYRLGDRVSAFKAKVEKANVEINQLWRDWERVQKQLSELGAEVLGNDFKQGGTLTSKRLRGKEIACDPEHERWKKSMHDQIERTGMRYLEKMKAVEKEVVAQQKKQQLEFIQQLFAEDD